MIITWYGEGCFKIQTGGLAILTDPFPASTGLTPPRFKADLTIYTRTPLPPGAPDEPGSRAIAGPGEYEASGVRVNGWALESRTDEIQSAYLVIAEDLTLACLGGASRAPSPELAERFGGADILFVPVGGAPHLDAAAAGRLVKQLAPKLVIPSFFRVPGLRRKADDVTRFLTELGQRAESQDKLSIKHKDLPQSIRAVVLSLEH